MHVSRREAKPHNENADQEVDSLDERFQ
jgi:hypothetical protein